MKLIKFSENYADEFDVDGFKIMSDEMWKEWQDRWKAIFDEHDELDEPVFWYFGSNEELIWEEGFDIFMNCFTVTDISLRRAEHIEIAIGKSFGFFPE